MKKPKITVLDIETCAITASVWGLFDQSVGLNMIQEDWRILSFASKTLGERPVLYVDAPTKAQEFHLLQALWEVLDASDLIVAHNGKKFDVRKINARLIAEGFPPYSPIRVVDTLLAARQVAAFTSNKLEYLSGLLVPNLKKDAHKEFPGFELWKEFLAGNPRAIAVMRKYNIRDIVSLEKVYLKLRPWIPNHPNLGVYVDSDKPVCPKCGSPKMQKRGLAFTNVGEYQRYHCGGCGGWSRGRTGLKKAVERAHILANAG